MLLSEAHVSPEQRAALFEALARMAGVTSLGTVADARGRSGEGVLSALPAADPSTGAHFTVIFDPRTSALLSWTVTNDVTADDTPTLAKLRHLIIASGHTDYSSVRPRP